MLTGHNGPAQVDGSDVVECGLGDLVKRRVPAGNTHADVVVENVDTPPTSSRRLDHRHERRLDSDVRFECDALSTRLSCYSDCLLGRGEIVVDCQHLGAFLSETQNRGTAIAQPLARRLTGAYDDGDLVLETHVNLVELDDDLTRRLDRPDVPTPKRPAGPADSFTLSATSDARTESRAT
jgi:hypothetical protein